MFIEDDISEKIKKEKEKDLEFKNEYEETKIKFDLIYQIIMLRKEKGITQKELAQLTKLKQQNISRIERLEAVPNLDTILKICYALGYTLELKKVS